MSRFIQLLVALSAGAALLALAACRDSSRAAPADTPRTNASNTSVPLKFAPGPSDVPAADPRRDATVITIEKVLPSVVNIATTELRQVSDPMRALLMRLNGQWPANSPWPVEKRLSIGSGVIIDEEGYVLTADHVVRSASEVWLKLADGRERQAERVILTGPSDVALLRIRAVAGDKFTPIRLAADDDLLLGETVLSLGNPFGLGGSVSRGILSSKNRRPPTEAEPQGPGDWLQTDAAINPGSSGGPLVNLRGELIGLNAAVQPGSEGIGFAIPIRAVTDSVSGVLSPENAQGLWFGALVKPRRGAESELSGVTVAEVETGSPADRAGLQVGDVITAINGRTPRTFMQFSIQLISAPKNEPLRLIVQRNGSTRSVTVRMLDAQVILTPAMVRQRTGALLVEMNAEQSQLLKLNAPQGLVVNEVEPDGPAAKATLPRGTVVIACDGHVANRVTDVAKVLYAKKPGETVTFEFRVVRQQGAQIFFDPGTAKVALR